MGTTPKNGLIRELQAWRWALAERDEVEPAQIVVRIAGCDATAGMQEVLEAAVPVVHGLGVEIAAFITSQSFRVQPSNTLGSGIYQEGRNAFVRRSDRFGRGYGPSGIAKPCAMKSWRPGIGQMSLPAPSDCSAPLAIRRSRNRVAVKPSGKRFPDGPEESAHASISSTIS